MIDTDVTVLKEVINIQKKIIEQLDTNVTRLEFLLKNEKRHRDNLEKKYKKFVTNRKSTRENYVDKDAEIEKLRIQVDSLISILYDLKKPINSHDRYNSCQSYINNFESNKNNDILSNKRCNSGSCNDNLNNNNIKVNSLSDLNTTKISDKPTPPNMSLLEELKETLKKKYPEDSN